LIRWTERAQNDLVAIADWIARQSRRPYCGNHPDANRSVGAISASRPKGRVSDTRELVIGRLPYVVIYTLVNRTPVILRILHGAMQWPVEED
jgi:plasmid stabilization system protein ParE